MKTYFVQVVFNNEGKTMKGTRYLSAIVAAKSKEHAEQKILDHYRQYYTAGDAGRFYVQCNWAVHVPTRAIIEKHWKLATNAVAPMEVGSFEAPRTHYFNPDVTKKDVMTTWDVCNASWASPAVHYNPSRGGYEVMLHQYMCMPSPFVFFKGGSKAAYDKARQFVKNNTFHGDYYVPFER